MNIDPKSETLVKLSKLQRKVVKDLQSGYVLCTDSSVKGAHVSSKAAEYHINNRVFWNLVDRGMIFQQYEWPFNYVLTKEGREIKL